ncbi:uncharacterized protein LOC134842208 [Symsagittifera roscoffensis]|uniref:uncharacterized protein LOC134842208 n=1 Tax=Symsagittifera roscoffensis TaxID=84072 RepID=UPI00307CC5C6
MMPRPPPVIKNIDEIVWGTPRPAEVTLYFILKAASRSTSTDEAPVNDSSWIIRIATNVFYRERGDRDPCKHLKTLLKYLKESELTSLMKDALELCQQASPVRRQRMPSQGSNATSLSDDEIDRIARSVKRPEELVYMFAISTAYFKSFSNFDIQDLPALAYITFRRSEWNISASNCFTTLLHLISSGGNLHYLQILLNEFDSNFIPVVINTQAPNEISIDVMRLNQHDSSTRANPDISRGARPQSLRTSQNRTSPISRSHSDSSSDRVLLSTSDPRLLARLFPGSSFTAGVVHRINVNGPIQRLLEDLGVTGLLHGQESSQLIQFKLESHVEAQSLDYSLENSRQENHEHEDLPEGDYLDEEDA